ncbi:hypothetical protein BDW62DRAFT_207689 [Aspergillus aurantiobrunneus]
MDEYAMPALTAKAISFQQTSLFRDYVLASFPCHFGCTKRRVSINWIEYVDQRPGLMNSCFDWAIRACTFAYLGEHHRDPEWVIASCEFYQRGLRGLSGLLLNEATAKSDEALASAILLAVFEMHNHSIPDAWLRHAAGIRTLMKFRGAKAHLEGFGRTMYLFYRNFFVTEALVKGEACFLDEPEWRALNEQIAADIAKSPMSSLYTETVERGFLEVSKTPGYFKRTRDFLAQPSEGKNGAHWALQKDLQAARAALKGISTDLNTCISVHGFGQIKHATFSGDVSNIVFERYSSLFADGLQFAILILEYLIANVELTQLPTPSSGKSTRPSKTIGYQRSLPPTVTVEPLFTEMQNNRANYKWMDRVISMMGLGAVSVRLIEY